jgi:hypothetical protein
MEGGREADRDQTEHTLKEEAETTDAPIPGSNRFFPVSDFPLTVICIVRQTVPRRAVPLTQELQINRMAAENEERQSARQRGGTLAQPRNEFGPPQPIGYGGPMFPPEQFIKLRVVFQTLTIL